MTPPVFDHERLDVYRLATDYVAFSYRIAKPLGGVNRQARDQWLRAAQSIPLNIQRTVAVSVAKIEYEYRDADDEVSSHQ